MMKLYLFISLVLLIFSGPLKAQAEQDSLAKNESKALPPELENRLSNILEKKSAAPKDKDPELDLGVLVINQTTTRVGNEFYQLLSQQVMLKGLAGTANVFIKEEPFRARLTRLIIHVNDTKVVESVLRPNSREYTNQLVEQSLQRISYYVENYEEVQKALGGEDLSGSGIY